MSEKTPEETRSRSFFAVAADKIMNGGGWFTFIRSSISSQIASWVDLGLSTLFFAFVFVALDGVYRSNLSVAVGAVAGGVVNCCINYRFTFHAKGQSVRCVAVKYVMIWAGSLLLNMYGTTFLSYALSHWEWLLSIGFKEDGIFATSRLIVSLIVSLAWNFVMQRNFVYRPSPFDRYILLITNIFSPHHNGHTNINNSENNENIK